MSIGAGGVIDQLWIALGIQSDTSGLRSIRQEISETKSSLLSIGGAVKAFVAGFAIKEVADIGATFENNRNSIAGFLSEMGLSSDFNAGLQDASDIVNKITIDAAKWPGEAEDYIRVFKAGLPFLKDAVPGGRNGIVDFLDNFTAVVKSKNPDIDIGTIARETRELFEGRAMNKNNVFVSLLSSLKLLDGQADITDKKFNAMTQPQRVQLLQALFTKMKPQIDAAAGSFDAMWGAAVSALKQMTRVATKPLFEGMKKALDAVNAALYDSNGKLTVFGQGIVDAISTGTGYLAQFLGVGGKLVLWFAQTKVGAAAFKVALGLLGTALTGLAVEKTVSSFASLLKVMTNLKSLMTGGLFLAIGLIAEDLYQFATGGDSVTGILVDQLGPALTMIEGALGLIAAALLAATLAGSPLIAVFLLLAAIGVEIYALSTHWDEFVGGMKATWEAFVQSIEDGANGIAAALGSSPIFNTQKNQESDLDSKYAKQRAILRARKAPLAVAIPEGYRPISDGQPWSPGWRSWTPADSMPSGGGSHTTNHVTNNTSVGGINVNGAKDPKAVAKETAREIVRTTGGGVKL
jgi:hypothetical protein